MTSKELDEQDEATARDWLRLGADFVKTLGKNQTRWHWQLFVEKKPAAVKLLAELHGREFYQLFMTRMRSFDLGIVSNVFNPLPIMMRNG